MQVGHYQLTERLGAGAYGEVWRAAHREDAALEVAVKRVHGALANDAEFVEALKGECRQLHRLDHPHIVRFRDLIVEDGGVSMVLELLEGRDVHTRIQQSPLPIAEVVQILEATLGGLSHAHAQGVVHRDVKPSNVFLCDDGRIKLLDFGVARAADAAHATRSGALTGTLDYIGPERFSGTGGGPVSDVYAAGLVAWEMLVGRPACPQGELAVKMGWHLIQGLTDPRQERPDCPDWLASLVLALGHKDPAQRPQDGAAAQALLREKRQPLTSGPAPAAPSVPETVSVSQAALHQLRASVASTAPPTPSEPSSPPPPAPSGPGTVRVYPHPPTNPPRPFPRQPLRPPGSRLQSAPPPVTRPQTASSPVHTQPTASTTEDDTDWPPTQSLQWQPWAAGAGLLLVLGGLLWTVLGSDSGDNASPAPYTLQTSLRLPPAPAARAASLRDYVWVEPSGAGQAPSDPKLTGIRIQKALEGDTDTMDALLAEGSLSVAAITITRDTISVGDVGVLGLSSGELDDDYLRGMLIPKLYDHLQKRMETTSSFRDALNLTGSDPRALFIIDERVSWTTVRPVLYTTGQAMIGHFDFAVSVGDPARVTKKRPVDRSLEAAGVTVGLTGDAAWVERYGGRNRAEGSVSDLKALIRKAGGDRVGCGLVIGADGLPWSTMMQGLGALMHAGAEEPVLAGSAGMEVEDRYTADWSLSVTPQSWSTTDRLAVVPMNLPTIGPPQAEADTTPRGDCSDIGGGPVIAAPKTQK